MTGMLTSYNSYNSYDPIDKEKLVDMIKMLLLIAGIEQNPGPPCGKGRNDKDDKKVCNNGVKGSNDHKKIKILSINVNGMGDHHKNKILMHRLNGEFIKNDDTFAFIQETHLKANSNFFTYAWRGVAEVSPGNGASCGLAILMSGSYEVKDRYEFIEGRCLILNVRNKNTGASLLLCNIYGPNVPKEKHSFYTNVFNKICELQIRHQESYTIVAGDFNFYLTDSDTCKTKKSANDKKIADLVFSSMELFGLKDAWIESKTNPHTWKKHSQGLYSTIDRVLLSVKCKLLSASTRWGEILSDHALVEVNLSIPFGNKVKGPGIRRLDPSILKSEENVASITKDFSEIISGIPDEWNPHAKLEYAKATFRGIIEVTSERYKKSVN
jgi:exonuclease III